MSITAIFRNAVKAAGLSFILAFSSSEASAIPNSFSVSDIDNAVSCRASAENHGEKYKDPKRYHNLESCIQAALSLEADPKIVFAFTSDTIVRVANLHVSQSGSKAERELCIYSWRNKATGFYEWSLSENGQNTVATCLREFIKALENREWDSQRATYINYGSVLQFSP